MLKPSSFTDKKTKAQKGYIWLVKDYRQCYNPCLDPFAPAISQHIMNMGERAKGQI